MSQVSASADTLYESDGLETERVTPTSDTNEPGCGPAAVRGDLPLNAGAAERRRERTPSCRERPALS